jgi:hypothetical protein
MSNIYDREFVAWEWIETQHAIVFIYFISCFSMDATWLRKDRMQTPTHCPLICPSFPMQMAHRHFCFLLRFASTFYCWKLRNKFSRLLYVHNSPSFTFCYVEGGVARSGPSGEDCIQLLMVLNCEQKYWQHACVSRIQQTGNCNQSCARSSFVTVACNEWLELKPRLKSRTAVGTSRKCLRFV